MSKQYGLITSGKNSDSKPKVFGSDSDSGDDAEKNVPTAAQQNVIRRQDLIAQQKALEEDPTVYQYDEVYDEMDEKKKESKLARKDVEKKPKYINRLLQSAARRKRENELRIERQVQKDRLAEGDTYKDKEEFVTSAYRKKLEELRELEEQEKREEYLEKIGDVTKQEDLGGFYRHLYEQKMKKDSDDDDNTSDKDKKKKASDKSESEEEKTNDKKRSDSKSNKESKKETTKDRKYRKRDESESENSESENHSKQKRHLQSNLDADSDFSIESTDSEKEDKKSHQKEKIKKESNSDKEEKPIKKSKNDPPLEFEPESKKKSSNDDVKPPVIKKQKVDIWKKRTVGDVFDDALQRYYERKNARLNG